IGVVTVLYCAVALAAIGAIGGDKDAPRLRSRCPDGYAGKVKCGAEKGAEKVIGRGAEGQLTVRQAVVVTRT
ncbi:hypothetical protein ABZ341_42120, partial [Streptomyces sp. NPDC006173]|uniref:hypothetical protein n=1 Tax=Streptomyces sp. NPDC006173 TaxID=3155349 RepID=UPI0033C18F0A